MRFDIVGNIILLVVLIDPFGTLPLFMTIIKNIPKQRRTRFILIELIATLILMLLFLYTGDRILYYLNIKTDTLSISGGIILFLIAIKMFFAKEDNPSLPLTKEGESFLTPLAIPSLVGPSVIATLLILPKKYPNSIAYLTITVIIAWFIVSIILLLAPILLNILGKSMINSLERFMGLILSMIAVQMFLDGFKIYLTS